LLRLEKTNEYGQFYHLSRLKHRRSNCRMGRFILDIYGGKSLSKLPYMLIFCSVEIEHLKIP
jgi:hypothetical protein